MSPETGEKLISYINGHLYCVSEGSEKNVCSILVIVWGRNKGGEM